MKDFEPLFFPRSVAVVGASSVEGKVGYIAMDSITSSGFKGKIFPVNPEEEEVFGLRAYKNIDSIPEEVDLFIFAISIGRLFEALERAIKKGGKGGVIFSAGFKEIGEEGAKLELKLKEIANRGNFKIIGPNTMGLLNLRHNLNATFIPAFSYLKEGSIAVISQSGGVGFTIVSRLMDNNLGIGKYVSIGNRANVEFADLIEYLVHDPHTDIILLYIEGIDDARRFYEVARKYAFIKPIIAYNAGFGSKARGMALTHTGTMASSPEIYRAAFKQAGILQVDSTEDLALTAKILHMSPPVNNSNLVIMTHTAGPSIITSDICERGGVKLVNLAEETKRKIREAIYGILEVGNPVDMPMAGFDHRLYLKPFEHVIKDGNTSAVLIIYTSWLDGKIRIPIKECAALSKEYNKPLFALVIAPEDVKEEMLEWERHGIPVFNSPEKAARSIVNYFKYYELKRRAEGWRG